MTVVEAIQRGIATGTMLHHDGHADADHQLAWVWALAMLAPDGPAVEVGVWKGGSLATWATARQGRGRIIAVDNWYGVEDSATRKKFVSRMVPGIELIDADSWEAPARISGQVAFCFIDANHGEGIARDILVWPDKILPGGILAFHDYDVWKPTVKVKECVDGWQKRASWICLGRIGSLIAYRRPAKGEAVG